MTLKFYLSFSWVVPCDLYTKRYVCIHYQQKQKPLAQKKNGFVAHVLPNRVD